MGKYTKKSRITGDIAVMEVTQSTALGVRTRARTLALQRLQQSPSTTATTTAAAAVVSCPNPDSSSCYLELRSRRLEKSLPPPPQPSVSKTHKTQQGKVRLCGAGGEKKRESSGNKGGLVKCEPSEAEDMGGIGVEASCGENCLDFELRGSRSTRETTPCSFIRDSETLGTPGSTTRQNRSVAIDRRITNVKNAEERNVPTTNEMEEFFSCVEQQQQRLFIEKYNFDVINDMPLPGRYEWV